MQKTNMNTKGSGIERENALLNFRILDTEPEEAYDELARLAAYVCKTPIALITFIDKEREWIKSAVGIEVSARDIPYDRSFGARVISEPEEFLAVFDPAGDESLSVNPLLQNQTDIGFYAGVPLKDCYGNKIGSLCVLGYKPKDLSFEQLSLLETIARQVMLKLEQRPERRDQRPLIELNKHESQDEPPPGRRLNVMTRSRMPALKTSPRIPAALRLTRLLIKRAPKKYL